mgnify:CR=1 FL=1
MWQQEASDLLAGAYYRKPGTLKWQYLRKEPLSFASRPGQVTLNYGANKFAVEARDTVMECAWRVREEQGTADVPTTDLWALETAIQEERDRRFQEGRTSRPTPCRSGNTSGTSAPAWLT